MDPVISSHRYTTSITRHIAVAGSPSRGSALTPLIYSANLRTMNAQGDPLKVGPCAEARPRFEGTSSTRDSQSLGENLSQPDSYSPAERNFLYFPSGKHPLCRPLIESHLHRRQVRPEDFRRFASTASSSRVYSVSLSSGRPMRGIWRCS